MALLGKFKSCVHLALLISGDYNRYWIANVYGNSCFYFVKIWLILIFR